MDAPENSGNRIGRTIWTVWGYLSGAVARYLRPEVTAGGNQSAQSRSDDIDLKIEADNINKESKTEEKRCNQIDKSTAEVRCSFPEVRAQVASVQWENTEVVKDDRNDVDTTKKQTYRFAMWSTGAENRGDRDGCEQKGDADVEKEAVSLERVHLSSENNESRTAQVLEEIGQIEQKDDNNEECDQNHEDELYGGDVELEKQIDMAGHGETEGTGGFKHADEHLIDKKETQIDLNDQEKTENDEKEKGQELDLLPQLEYSSEEMDDLSKSEMVNIMEKCYDEMAEFFKNEAEEIMPEQHEESESARELEETRHIEEKDGDNEECDQKDDYENCEMKNEGPDNTDVMVQSDQETKIVHQNDQDRNENHEEKGPKLQAQDLQPQLEYSTDSFRTKWYVMQEYSDEFYKNEVEKMTLETEQDEDTTESEQDMTKSELLKSVETQLKVSDTPENSPQTGTGSPVVALKTQALFSDLIACEASGELRKGSETASAPGGFEEIPTNLHELQSLAEEHLKRETHVVDPSETQKALEQAVEIKKDFETLIQSLGATESQTHKEIDKAKFSLTELEFGTDLTAETIETKISLEDEETEPFETESQLSIIANVTFEPHELLEFTQGECQSSLGTMDSLNESLGNSAGPAKIEHGAEDRPDEKPVLTRSLSPAEFEKDSLDLQSQPEQCTEEQEILEMDLAKIALQYVKEITNQVLKEMIETETNLAHETEPSAGLSEDAEYPGPVECVSADAFVLEEESKLSGETMEGKVEMEVETASKQNEQHSSAPECETTKIDTCHEQQTYHWAMVSTGTNHGGSISGDMDCEEHKEDTYVEKETVSESQAERLFADSECQESETAQELDQTGQAEQKDGNSEGCEDPDNAVIDEQMNTTDHGEKQDRNADEQKETKTVDQKDQENDEQQEPKLKADAFDLEDEGKILGQTMDSYGEMEVETASKELVKQTEETVSSQECETSEADGRHEQIQKVIAGETLLSGHEGLMEVSKPGMKRGFEQVSKDPPEVKTEGQFDLDLQVFEDSSLDFAAQKSRIAVKNPLVRPPKDPRKLISKTSVEPLLQQPSPCSQRADGSALSKGMIGFKLPGLGAGLPVLRKTAFVKKAREDGEAESSLHPQQKSAEVTDDRVKEEQLSAKPKWTPPKHPGMGNPLVMAELKNKLKKPKE